MTRRCGNGSLLLKFAKVLGKEECGSGILWSGKSTLRPATSVINMFPARYQLRKFDIALGDTLLAPKHWDDEPFRVHRFQSALFDQMGEAMRIRCSSTTRVSPRPGILAPKSKADLAATMHMLSWLATNGTAAIVEFPGVLYRGGAEQKIRKYLIDNNYIDTVIQLPANLFFGVGIATCIIVLKKSKKDNATLFIDASNEFVHEGQQRTNCPMRISRGFSMRSLRKDDAHFAHLVENDKIAENDYNISVSSYVEQPDTREVIDIDELNERIAGIVARQHVLRTAIDAIVATL